MILIFSNSTDYTTYEVMKWLSFLGHDDVVRINADELKTTSIKVMRNDFVITVGDQTIRSKDLSVVWYRKGLSWFRGAFQEVAIDGHEKLSSTMNRIADHENQVLMDYLHHLIEQKATVLGSAFKSNLNKLVTLNLAESVGLKVPDFMVSDQTADFVQLQREEPGRYITKAMSDGLYLFDSEVNQQAYFTYTEPLESVALNQYAAKLSPSFAQRKIEKKYEVRVFYLDGTFYSWAILSQQDEQTRVDYRKYNNSRPNRNIAYDLPDDIQQKLHSLFIKVGLNTGSVDLMVDHEHTYYFLEINPVGQYGLLSKLTNYQLDKRIAQWMIDHEQR